MNLVQQNQFVQSESQNHQCQDIQGLCMKIGCDPYYCQLCYKKSHSNHKKYGKCIQDVEQLLQKKLNQNQQLASDLEFLQQKVLNINLFFQNQIEIQQQEIQKIIQWIKDFQFNEIQSKIHMIRQIYNNDNNDIKIKIINIELKEYIEQILNTEMQWTQRIQFLMSQIDKKQKIIFLSDDSDFTSSSSEEKEEVIENENDSEDQQYEDNFKIKQFTLVQNQEPDQQQDLEKVQEQKDDEQRNNQQQQENMSDEDYSWKLILSENLYQEAYVLNSQKKMNEAIQKLNESLEIFPNNLEALKLKSLTLFQQEKYSEVIDISDQIIKQDKSSLQQYREKGVSLIKLKRYQDALVCFEESISVDPKDEQVQIYKGHCLMTLKKYQQAIDCAQKIIHNCQLGKFHLLKIIGESLYYLEKYEEAFDYVTQALNLDQRVYEINRVYCFILIRLNQFEAALTSLEVLNSLHQWPLILLQSSILRWLKRFDEAQEKCQQAININPHNKLIINESDIKQKF